MTKFDTRLQIEHDPSTDRMRIEISMPAARWRLAFLNYRWNFDEVLSRLGSQNRLAKLFMELAMLFMDDEATHISASDGRRTWQWGFCDGNKVHQVQVEVIDRPLLQSLNEPETDVAN